MITRNLLKPFLTFSLFALLLLPQISGPGSAFAAGPPIKDEVNPICLDVGNSTAFGGVGTAINPPGQQVEAHVVLHVINLCTANNPVSNVTISGTLNTTCAAGAIPDKPVPIILQVPGPLDQKEQWFNSGVATSRCVISANDVPISSVLPVSVNINLTANGTDTLGRLVSAPPDVINITW